MYYVLLLDGNIPVYNGDQVQHSMDGDVVWPHMRVIMRRTFLPMSVQPPEEKYLLSETRSQAWGANHSVAMP